MLFFIIAIQLIIARLDWNGEEKGDKGIYMGRGRIGIWDANSVSVVG